MAISDIEARQGNVEVVGEITEISEPREFSKFGKSGRVANAMLKDVSGTIKLTLWNEQIDKVKVGDKVHIKNGYVNEWQGEKQLTTGKFGTLEVIETGKVEEGKEPDTSKQEESVKSQEKTKRLSDSEDDKETEVESDSDFDVDEEEIY